MQEKDCDRYSEEEADRRLHCRGQSWAEYEAQTPKEYRAEGCPGAIKEKEKSG
jgi:hypothetical protein